MRPRETLVTLGCICGLLAGPSSASALRAQEADDGPVSLHGIVQLEAPEGSASPEASGVVYLRQVAERAAIHVHVSGLVPGATYDVLVSSGENSESIGTITTHGGEAPAPRHFHARLVSPDCESAAGDDPARRG